MADVKYIEFSCVDLVKAGFANDVGCCNSCHDDEDEYNYSMCSRTLEQNIEVCYDLHVCCAKSQAVRGIDNEVLLEALLKLKK